MNDGAFLILFMAFTAFMGLAPFLLRKIGVPTVISLLLVGMIVGPTGLGVDLVGHISHWLSFLGKPGMEAETAQATASSFR